ncbi:SixA phosphatase family protein [Ascidiimonas aurantiaca]|uniref:SixA phosphatase family protein n=1 Tax=Ascidiimonas aurantiaca TaxID=1685432 RepID=UPI0030ED72E8
MKKVHLVRHAKSSWDYSVEDKDRPLNERGISDAHLVSRYLARESFSCDTVFSSPANRALHTCMIFMRNLQTPLGQVTITNSLYDFSGDSVISFLKDLNSSLEEVMLFGHNHAFTHLANSFGNEYIDNVPTSGFVSIQFDIAHWTDLTKGSTLQTVFPKQLK